MGDLGGCKEGFEASDYLDSGEDGEIRVGED